MAIESFYFSHDYNARADRKLVALQMSFGMEGVGIFWCIVEMLFEEGGYINLNECDRIAFELRTDSQRINQIISGFDLFKSDGSRFWSASVLRRLEVRYEKSEKARKSAEKRWGNADAMRTHSESNAIKERNERKKGKETNRKGEKENLLCDGDTISHDAGTVIIKTENISTAVIEEEKVEALAEFETVLFPTFDDFWRVYDKNIDRAKTEKSWNELKQEEKESIMIYLSVYVLTTPDKKYRKNPHTFIMEKAWLNEIIEAKSNGVGITKQATMERLNSYED